MPIDYESLNSAEGWHVTDLFTEERYRQMSKFAPAHLSSILDIGSGSGRGGIVLKAIFPAVAITGLDAVKQRTENSENVYTSLIYSSDKDMPFQNDNFDFIVAGEVLEHIAVKEVDYFLCEIFRILKPSGVFVLTTPNPNDIKLRIRRMSILGGSHISQHFPKATKIRMNFTGFRITKVRGTGKTSRYIGGRFPLFVYGSYLLVAKKI